MHLPIHSYLILLVLGNWQTLFINICFLESMVSGKKKNLWSKVKLMKHQGNWSIKYNLWVHFVAEWQNAGLW
jgi:hypothetical protein